MAAAARESLAPAPPTPPLSRSFARAAPRCGTCRVDETAADEPVVADDDDAGCGIHCSRMLNSRRSRIAPQQQAAPSVGRCRLRVQPPSPCLERTRDELPARDAVVRETFPLRSTRDKSIVRSMSIAGVPASDISAPVRTRLCTG